MPGVDIPADLRDALQNGASGDFGEAALDLVGLIPLLGEAPKAIELIETWVKANPGQADEAYRLFAMTGFVNKIPEKRVDDYYRAFGKYGELKRLSGQVSDSKYYKGRKAFATELRDSIKTINKRDGDKLTGKFTMSDIERAVYDDTGQLVVLINTNKWATSSDMLKAPGKKHILARHGHKNADEGKFSSIEPGKIAERKKGTSLFPKSYSEREITNLIMRALDSDNKKITLDQKLSGGLELVYNVNKDGIKN